MIFDNTDKDLSICSRLFPNLCWLIESASPNRVLYEGKSSTPLVLHVEGTLEGYRTFLVWNKDAILLKTELPAPGLLGVLHEIKDEWHKINEVMK
jgi:hypothetical protein